MPLHIRKNLSSIALLLCAGLVLTSMPSFAQKKKSATPTQKTGPTTESANPIAVHEFSGEGAEGVDVALMEVTRTAPGVVTVKWEYRNKTAKPQKLAGDSKGWSDPYRLSWNTYLLGEDGKTKLPLMRDADRRPVAALNGKPNQLTIAVPPRQSVKVWAKYSVPAETKKVGVVISGTEPFEGVEVKELPQPAAK